MTDRDPAYLWDIVEAGEKIIRYVQGQSLETYLKDDLVRDAVERNLEIIGEAVRRISEALKQAHPAVPWKKIVGLRNILTHDYDAVNDNEIWEVATIHIPELVRRLKPLIPPPPPDVEK